MERKEKFSLFITSTLLNVSAILLAFIVFQSCLFFLTKLFHIPIKLGGFRILFDLPANSPRWSAYSIIAIYGLPPFLCLFFAILSRKFHEQARRKRSNFKLFLIWANIHFLNLFWGSIIAGLLTRSGFSYFLSWLYIPFFVQIFFAIGAILLLYFRHSFLNYSFLQTAPASKYIQKKYYVKYKLLIVYLPFLTGVVFLSTIGFPDFTIHEFILKLTPFLSIISIYKYLDYENIKLVRNSAVFTPNYGIIIFLALFFVTYFFL